MQIAMRATPKQRRMRVEEDRCRRVTEKAEEIIKDPLQLASALEHFRSCHGETALILSLSTIAQCRTPEQYVTHGSSLRSHVRSIVNWHAEHLVPPIPRFLLPQAD